MSGRKNETYAEAKRRLWGEPIPSHLKHGPNTYAVKYYGCPCGICLPSGRRTWANTEDATGPKSHAERQKALRLAKRGQAVPASVKHGVYAYWTYDCKCDICSSAVSRGLARRRNAWRSRARGRWTTVGENEMICWPPRDAEPDWICPDCASGPNRQEMA